MQLETAKRLSETLPHGARVLDVGGGAQPFPRADWVIDALAHEERASLGRLEAGQERFGSDTWVQWDLCAREPWPFEDNFFDFAVCSHLLEDVRDPIWVCAELNLGQSGLCGNALPRVGAITRGGASLVCGLLSP